MNIFSNLCATNIRCMDFIPTLLKIENESHHLYKPISKVHEDDVIDCVITEWPWLVPLRKHTHTKDVCFLSTLAAYVI